MNKALTFLILFVVVGVIMNWLNVSFEAFRGEAGGGGRVGAVANGPGAGALSHEGLGRYGWNAFDNSVVSATKFCHHNYDCASNRCSALGVCV
jgi:hypothetical protein